VDAPDVPVHILRKAAQDAVERGSLRGAARAIPLTPMGLRAFTNGTKPTQRWSSDDDH